MKKTLKILFIVFICFISLNVTSVSANKYGGQLINGTRNITYTVNGGANDYTININSAAYNWMYTGYDNPIYMTPVSSLNGSTIDIYIENITDNIIARTYFFNAQSVQMTISSLSVQNWLYNEIYINDKYKYDYSIDHTGTMAHEFGHAMGLAHTNNRYSIMCQTLDGSGPNASGRIVQTPQMIDSEEIVEIYGRY